MNRLLKAYGVPPRYHDVDEDLTSHVTSVRVEQPWVPGGKLHSVTITRQRDIMGRLLDAPPDGVVGIGSAPTDDYGMRFATMVLKRSLNRSKDRVQMIDLGDPPRQPKPAAITVLHNVTPTSHAFRFQICRDLLVRLDGNLRIVVVGGRDPVSFFYDVLHYPLDHALMFRGDDASL